MERRLPQHAEARAAYEKEHGVAPGPCERCADIQCKHNITPYELLPSESDPEGKADVRTCENFERDPKMPSPKKDEATS